MQKIFNYLSFIFIFIRYRNKKDPFKSFQKIVAKSKIKLQGSKKNIILVPFRVAPVSNLFEGLIGFFYKLRGYDVKAIMCNQSVQYCENITYRDESKRLAICALCLKEQKRFCNTFGIEPLEIDKYISEDEKTNIDICLDNLEIKSDDSFIINGINFEKVVKSAVIRYCLKSDINFDGDKEIIKGYYRTALICDKAAENIFNLSNAQKVIMSHGVYSTWGTILNVAKRKNISSYVWARGYVGQGNLMFGKNYSYLEDLILEPKEVYQSLNYTEEDIANTIDYFKTKKNRSSTLEYVNYYSIIESNKESLTTLYEENNIKPDKKVFGMFTNIPWDGQIFNQTVGFPNTSFYINSVFSWFIKNPDCILIIRAHPAEIDKEEGNGSEKFSELLYREFPKLPPNILFIPANSPISSYALADKIDAAVVYGSSIGLELAIAGIQVIQAGRFNTSNKEIVFEASTEDELYDYFNQAKEGSLSMNSTQKSNAIKFGNYWICKRHILDDTVILERLIFQDYNFKTLDDFAKNKTLNFIFEKIESDASILNL